MEVYKISHEDMMKWCSIPEDQLVGHPDSKVDLKIFDSRRATMEMAGNMMADEVKKNNAEGKITKWILGSGPEDQFQTFIDRVNNERISLKNLIYFLFAWLPTLLLTIFVPGIATWLPQLFGYAI